MYQTDRQKWIEPPSNLNISNPFIRAFPLKLLQNGQIQYQAITDRGRIVLSLPPKQSYEMSKGDSYDDMCEMNILNQPEVLRNIVERYKKDQIFTSIGPTLIIVNPYRKIEKLFNQEILQEIREKILTNNLKKERPHVYLIAGKAYISMKDTSSKQAIVISGESGAGKTESTKYCMQLLTSLSAKRNNSVEQKILACNPLLEAFGNSKTVRNDNSSRFGKYVQIYFNEENLIKGANIRSYLLEKSRVTSISPNQRSFHVFYALAASAQFDTRQANHYSYLKQSNCYLANHINDKQYFQDISYAFQSLGFTRPEELRIWNLLSSILKLGNIDFDDANQIIDQSKSCSITNAKMVSKICQQFNVDHKHLERVLLFQKKRFLKEYTHSPFSKQACRANRNAFSKAVYNAIFQFILKKIQTVLRPEVQSEYKQINILDIFGFQNFEENSFQQLCINFTNEKLLKLYNMYVFEREMQILKEDGLENEIMSILPPTNDEIISLINGKLSIFSIINDLTLPNQFKDEDIIQSFQSQIKNSSSMLSFNKILKNKFNIVHTQCSVMYNIHGFKHKNQDKINQEIMDIVNKIFVSQEMENVGKTILTKFSKQIDDLITQLNQSSVHFIRCIKPNQQKIPNFPEEKYVLTQIRYLGVFQTILIRKKTFPARKSYKEFLKSYKLLFPKIKESNERTFTEKVMIELSQKQSEYLLGRQRIYMNKDVEDKLNVEIFKFLKIRNEKVKKIQSAYKRYKYRRFLLQKLHLLATRIRILKCLPRRCMNWLNKESFLLIKNTSNLIQEKEMQIKEEERKQMMIDAKKKRQEEQRQLLKIKRQQQVSKIPLLISRVEKVIEKLFFYEAYTLVLKHTEKISKNMSISKNNSLYIDSNLDDVLTYNGKINETFKVENSVIDRHAHYQKIETPSSNLIDQEFKFSEEFIQEIGNVTSQSDHQGILFWKGLALEDTKNHSNQHLNRLRCILSEKYKVQIEGNQEDFFSPMSADCNFKIDDLPEEIFEKIVNFPVQEFFNSHLRKRTTFLGTKKTYQEILTCKKSVLNKSMTLMSNPSDEKKCLGIFKLILKIGQELKIENVLKIMSKFISECQNSSIQLKNEIFIQLLRQSNTSSELSAVRVYQAMTVFLHVYTPSEDCLFAGLNLLFFKINQKKGSQNQVEFVLYLFKKILRKIEKRSAIGYIPIGYQIMGLMCKRQISIPVYLPTGNSILVRAESSSTFGQIKERSIKQFGIDIKRLKPQIFAFFEIINFQNEELEETPIKESNMVWDMMTYWQLTKTKYEETGIQPPHFFLMLKIRFAFQITEHDQQAIELSYSQCYFDYFMGRIILGIQKMVFLACLIKKMKYQNRNVKEIVMGVLPLWITKKMKKQNVISLLVETCKELQQFEMTALQIKYRFLQMCQECPIAMSMAIPTDQPIKLYLKPRGIFLVQKTIIVEQYSMKRVLKWRMEKDKFIFEAISSEAKQQNKIHTILTEYGSICNQYLNIISQMKYPSQNTSKEIANFKKQK